MRQPPTPEQRLDKARRYGELQQSGLEDLLDDVEVALMEKWVAARSPSDDAKLCAERDGLKALRQRLSAELGAAKKILLDEESRAKAAPRKKKGS